MICHKYGPKGLHKRTTTKYAGDAAHMLSAHLLSGIAEHEVWPGQIQLVLAAHISLDIRQESISGTGSPGKAAPPARGSPAPAWPESAKRES